MPKATSPPLTNPSNPQQPYLTLPRDTFAKLAPASFLHTHLTSPSHGPEPLRPNGRRPRDFRVPILNTNNLSHCAGSVVVRTGDTSVVCGIQPEILLARDVFDEEEHNGESTGSSRRRNKRERLRQLNLMVPNVDIQTGCSPQYLPGRGAPTVEAQSIASQLYSLLLDSDVVDLDDLAITSTSSFGTSEPASPTIAGDEDSSSYPKATYAYWTLYISILPLSLSGTTSLIDTLFGAVLASLRSLQLPSTWYDADLETVLCSPDLAHTFRLNLQGRPVCMTWGVFVPPKNGMVENIAEDGDPMRGDQEDEKMYVLADPDSFEDPLCGETLTAVADFEGRGSSEGPRVLGLSKSGGAMLTHEEVVRLLKGQARTRWEEWDGAMPR